MALRLALWSSWCLCQAVSQCVDDPDGVISGSLGADWCCVGCKNPLVSSGCSTMVNGVPLRDLCLKSCGACQGEDTVVPTPAPTPTPTREITPQPTPEPSGGCTDDASYLHATGKWSCADLSVHKQACQSANQAPTCWTDTCDQPSVSTACPSTCEACTTTTPTPECTPTPTLCTPSPCTCLEEPNTTRTLVSDDCFRCTPPPTPADQLSQESDSEPWWVAAALPFFFASLAVLLITIVVLCVRDSRQKDIDAEGVGLCPPDTHHEGAHVPPAAMQEPQVEAKAETRAEAEVESTTNTRILELRQRRELLKQEKARLEAEQAEEELQRAGGQRFPTDAKVEANWNGTWCSAVVIGYEPATSTYMVRWVEDSTETAGVAGSDIRLPVSNPITAVFGT